MHRRCRTSYSLMSSTLYIFSLLVEKLSSHNGTCDYANHVSY
jgi:hypothetical protein